jgi:hypothetical protein
VEGRPDQKLAVLLLLHLLVDLLKPHPLVEREGPNGGIGSSKTPASPEKIGDQIVKVRLAIVLFYYGHSQSVRKASGFRGSLCVPIAIIPLNGANKPVAFSSYTAP